MPDTLFAPDTGLSDAERIRRTLLDAYEAELLDRPPVSCLQPDNPRRQAEAHRLALKDVSRALRALERAGLRIVEAR